MSHYTSRASTAKKNYVVIKHGIPNVNSIIMGVKFRGGYAVVEKDSKIHHSLKKLPMLKNPGERPLAFLKDLPFITRSADVKLIYGADVYAKYIDAVLNRETSEEQKAIEEEKRLHLEDTSKCTYTLESGKYCKNTCHHPEITRFCQQHILSDPKLKDIDFVIPMAMDSKERKKLRKTAFNKLKQAKKSEEITNDTMVEEAPRAEEEQSDRSSEDSTLES